MNALFIDVFGKRIVLTDSRWKHIIGQHPEVRPHLEKITKVVSDPDFVKRSKKARDTYLYYKYYKEIYEGKYLLVVVNYTGTPNILTCYITDRIKEGEHVWKRD